MYNSNKNIDSYEFYNFFKLSIDIFMILDLEGKILYTNEAIKKILGYEKEDILGILLREIIHPDDLVNSINTNKFILHRNNLDRNLNRCKTKYGYYKWLEWNSVPDLKDNKIYAIARDVTETKRLEVENTYSKIKHQEILESISDSYYSLDNKLRFTYINKNAEKLLNLNQKEILGKYIGDVYPQIKDTIFFEKYNQARNSKLPINFEAESEDHNFWFDVYIYPSHEGLSIYFKDITKKKKVEKELARYEQLTLIGEMAVGIGHEVRNPLTTVRGFLQLLLMNKNSSHIEKEYFELMIDELDRANSIITEFLSLAKNKTVNMKNCNLNDIIQTLYPLLNSDAIITDKQINLECYPIPNILLDEKEIRQLVLNLVHNGIEAMNSGGTLTIKTYPENEYIILAIIDQGHGIPFEIIDEIGKPFFTTKAEGTGLGLAICYSIATRHKAKIEVSSKETGTTFLVKFNKSN